MTIYVVKSKNIGFERYFTEEAQAKEFASLISNNNHTSVLSIPFSSKREDKYILPVPNTWRQLFTKYQHKYVAYNGKWNTTSCLDDEDASLGTNTTFTREQLNDAPDWVKKIVPVRAFTLTENMKIPIFG